MIESLGVYCACGCGASLRVQRNPKAPGVTAPTAAVSLMMYPVLGLPHGDVRLSPSDARVVAVTIQAICEEWEAA